MMCVLAGLEGLIWESIDDSKDEQAVRDESYVVEQIKIIADTSNDVSAKNVVDFADFKARKANKIRDSFEGVTALAA